MPGLKSRGVRIWTSQDCQPEGGPAPGTDDGPPWRGIWGRMLLLGQVFQNLLSNAIKFVQKGVRPRIRITGERCGDQVILDTIDNGIGVSHESEPGKGSRFWIRLRAAGGDREE